MRKIRPHAPQFPASAASVRFHVPARRNTQTPEREDTARTYAHPRGEDARNRAT